MALTWDQALAWRLRRQLLHPLSTGSVGDVIGRLGAVPAFPETTPELAVGLRRIGSRFGDVARALDAANCWFFAIGSRCSGGSSDGLRFEQPIAPFSRRSARCCRLEVGTGWS